MKNPLLMAAATLLALGLAHTGSAQGPQHASAARTCADLTRPGLFPNTVVQKAVAVPADAETGTPAFCEVTAQISPVAGSKITAVYRLPDTWNGRMLGLGGGGFAGILILRVPSFVTGPSRAADAGLPRGYATAQTTVVIQVRRVSTRRGSPTTPLQSPISATVPFTR